MKSVFLVFFLLMFSIFSCKDKMTSPDLSEDDGDLSFSIDLSKAPIEVFSVEGFLARTNFDTIFIDFDISNNRATAVVYGIVPGTWSLTVNVYNTEGIKAYSGSTEVEVFSGVITPVTLVLNPATGDLDITVIWGDQDPCLVAYYPFSGNANDESGNGNDGVVNGATLTEDRFGNSNSAYYFDGIDDYIQIPDDDILSPVDNRISISAWIKVYSSYNKYILYKGSTRYNREYAVGIRLDTLASFHINNLGGWDSNQAGIWSNSKISNDTWYHIVGIWDGSQITIYVNGEYENTRNLSFTIGNYDSDLYIGTYGGKISEYAICGVIDDIRIYNRPLTANEVFNLYNAKE